MKYFIRISLYLIVASAVALSCTDEWRTITRKEQMNFSGIPLNKIINLDVDKKELSADGAGLITLTATIPADAKKAFKSITFIASDGLGDFQGTAGKDANVAVADDAGKAQVTLKVGIKPGTYSVAAKISSDDETYKTADIPIVLTAIVDTDRLKLTKDKVPAADGASTVLITVTISGTRETTGTITTNLGTFVNATATQSLTFVNSQATATLRVSNDPAPHVITCKVKDIQDQVMIITPTLSYPQLMQFEPAGHSVAVNGSVKIDVFLKRTNSAEKVSKGIPATFFPYQIISNKRVQAGRITGLNAAVTDDAGKLSATLLVDTEGIQTTSPVYVRITAKKGDAVDLPVDSIKFTIKP